ncbi:hypothetical protein G6F57_006785 [Rhizopus arrhizus]|nr:hypothetical protein G6F57_006785 [Rhizopus arrhizus]
MFSSLLKIEQQLKCDICTMTLNQATAVGECGHRFCYNCISKNLSQASKCPTCNTSAKSENLCRDRLHDNLVDYVDQLKKLSLTHSLTPMELSYQTRSSLYETQEESSINDLVGKRKQTESLSPRKKPATEKSTNALLDNSMDVLVQARQKEDAGMEDSSIERTETAENNATSQIYLSQATSSNEQWKCPDCLFLNPVHIQTCGICRKYKNTPIIQSKAGDTIETKPSNISKDDQSYEPTVLDNDQVKESATIKPPKTRSPENRKSKEVHVMYTGLTPEDDTALDKLVNHTLDTKLKIFVHYKMRDFNDVTHIITSVDEDQLCKRTLKYLQGILEGKWIMTPQWLIKSIESQQWLPEDLYEVKGDHVTGTTQGPSRGRDRQKHNKNPLFDGMKFYFFGDFSGKHNKNDLLVLCRAGGAKILSRKPNGLGHRIDPAIDPLDPNEPIVIMCLEKKKSTSAWLYESQVRDPSWIIECISKLAIV